MGDFMFVFIVNEFFNHMSIRDFLSFYHLSKKIIHLLQMRKQLFVNGMFVSFDTLLNENDMISIDWKDLHPVWPEPVDKNVTCLYEDDDIAIFDKPSGLLVHEDGNIKDTLTNRVSAYYLNKKYPYPVLPVHRIDHDTSGMIIFGKHPLSMSYLSYLFESHDLIKMYACLVDGIIKDKKGVIEKPMSGDRHSNKQIVSKDGKSAKTRFEVVSYEDNHTRCHVYIEGGRKHQIRVHLQSIGFPIIGDKIYGKKSSDRLMLHFKKIEFKHPRTLETFECISNEPF